MSVSQAIQILKEIYLIVNQKNHVKIIKNNNLWIKENKVKKVKNLVIQLKNKNKIKFFKQKRKIDQKVKISIFKICK